jgi:hypothetical protein
MTVMRMGSAQPSIVDPTTRDVVAELSADVVALGWCRYTEKGDPPDQAAFRVSRLVNPVTGSEGTSRAGGRRMSDTLDMDKVIRRKMRVEVPEGAQLVIVRAPIGTSAEQAQAWGQDMAARLKQSKETGEPFVLILPPQMGIDDVKAIVGVKPTETSFAAEIRA